MKHLALIVALIFTTQAMAVREIKDLQTIFGTGTSSNVDLEVNVGTANNPTLRFNVTENEWQRSDDGLNFESIGSGGGADYNLMLNPGFEKATYDESWTVTGSATVTEETTDVVAGESSLKAVMSANSVSIKQTSALYQAEIAGMQGYITFFAKNTAPGAVGCHVAAGTTSTTDCVTLATDGTWRQYEIPVVLSATSNGVDVHTGTTAGTLIVDDFYVGLLTNKFPEVSQAQIAVQGYFAATTNCQWSRSSSTIGAFGTDADCPGPTIVTESVCDFQATDADLPKITGNSCPPGKYLVRFNVPINSAAAGTPVIAINDGSSTCYGIATNETAGATTTHMIECAFEYTATANRSFEVYGALSSGSAIRIQNSATANPLFGTSFAVEYYPPESKVYSQKCTNNPAQCENVFSAKVDSSDVVTAENLDWISGNCTNATTGKATCNFQSNIFTVAPNCECTQSPAASAADNTCSIDSISSSSVVLQTSSNGSLVNQSFVLMCQKASTDFKAQQTITGTFAEMVKSIGSPKPKKCWAYFGGAGSLASKTNCTASPCTIYSESGGACGSVSVTRSSAGIYVCSWSNGVWANSVSATMGATTTNYTRAADLSGATTSSGAGSVGILSETNTGTDTDSYGSCWFEAAAP